MDATRRDIPVINFSTVGQKWFNNVKSWEKYWTVVQTFPSRRAIHCRLPCAGQNRSQSKTSRPTGWEAGRAADSPSPIKTDQTAVDQIDPIWLDESKKLEWETALSLLFRLLLESTNGFFDLPFYPSDSVQVGRVNRRSGLKRYLLDWHPKRRPHL